MFQPDIRLFECPICGDLDTPSTLQEPLGMLVKRWRTARKELTQHVPFYSDLLECSTGIELKTCGHTAHIKCFNAYRETIRIILKKFHTFNYVHFQNDLRVAFDALKDCIVYWKKTFTEAAPTRGQTHIIAAIKSNVERCMLFNKLSVAERRKNTRALITEHLIPASVARTSRRDEEISLYAVKDLLLPKIQEDFAVCFFLHLKLIFHHMIYIFLIFQPSCSDDGLTVSDDDLIDVVDLRPDDLRALQSVPLLLFDLKSLFVRLSSFVIDNQRLSKEDKRQLCRVLARRILRVTIVKTFLCLLLRCSRTTLERLIKGQHHIGGITGNLYYFVVLLLIIEDVTSFPSSFKWQLLDAIDFTAEFWRQSGILPKTNESMPMVTDRSIQEALSDIGFVNMK
uniref:RING-type E3 ubiquitin transferase n=1 Tax=Heterorhabditis bacteriophora TaxID=37862 RepID=A0A1I7X2G8_HETBA